MTGEGALRSLLKQAADNFHSMSWRSKMGPKWLRRVQEILEEEGEEEAVQLRKRIVDLKEALGESCDKWEELDLCITQEKNEIVGGMDSVLNLSVYGGLKPSMRLKLTEWKKVRDRGMP